MIDTLRRLAAWNIKLTVVLVILGVAGVIWFFDGVQALLGLTVGGVGAVTTLILKDKTAASRSQIEEQVRVNSEELEGNEDSYDQVVREIAAEKESRFKADQDRLEASVKAFKDAQTDWDQTAGEELP